MSRALALLKDALSRLVARIRSRHDRPRCPVCDSPDPKRRNVVYEGAECGWDEFHGSIG